ncbi:hypothetical protein K503DRAFT_472869 [Rhizopogon vinicolor AM-OR11-026]|uniref:Uncharacterized protein n=1 Tax=Rhizopogon vinicolor AM-OR11-026 TaxID=1314800 RepID=A0A1B7MN99_9AGAM|nr:hypothetical protein K503DRAFT_472869 [Rhizopogon vinicolor AM-OR11-026]
MMYIPASSILTAPRFLVLSSFLRLCTVTTNIEHIPPAPTSAPPSNTYPPFPWNTLRSLNCAQTELHQTEASLGHVGKVCTLKDMINKHNTITAEGATFLDLINALSLITHHHSSMHIHTGRNSHELGKYATSSIDAITSHALGGVMDEHERAEESQHAGRRKKLEA